MSLYALLQTELEYADPDLHDPTWQTITAARYWNDRQWLNINGKMLNAGICAVKTLDVVRGHNACFHTHPLISCAYALDAARKRAGSVGSPDLLADVRKVMDEWLAVIQATQRPDGSISRAWFEGKSVEPLTSEESCVLDGHTIEWLTVYLDDDQLRSAWMGRLVDRFIEVAIHSVSVAPLDHNVAEWPFEYAALCHGARGLKTYLARLDGSSAHH